MAAKCCLCAESLSDRKRVKRLYGSSCAEERAKLNELISRLQSVSLREFTAVDSVLCYKCSQALCKILKLEKQLRTLESDILTCVEKLNLNDSQTVPTKRPLTDAATVAVTEQPVAKSPKVRGQEPAVLVCSKVHNFTIINILNLDFSSK